MFHMVELRPCIVRIPDKTIPYRTNNGELKIRVIQEAEEHKGFFHKWSSRIWAIGGEAPIGCGQGAGKIISQTFAIVEYEDGTVHEHYPQEIRFTDRDEQ